jgi:hypothetical protein
MSTKSYLPFNFSEPALNCSYKYSHLKEYEVIPDDGGSTHL